MDVRILVPVSGGKDSQACLKLAVEHYPPGEVRGLFCDTRFEHPVTYAHVEWMARHYGVEIDTVCAGSVEEQCLKHKRFPGGGARFCTEELKIWPTKRYAKALAEQQGGFEIWYGMRSEESPARRARYAGKVCDELYQPHEVMRKYPQYLGKLGVRMRLAILDWSADEVMDFVGREYLNPLYPHFDRVGCFPCQAAGDTHKEKAYQYDDFGRGQYQKVIRIASEIQKSPWSSKGGLMRNNPDQGCLICSI